MDGEGGAAMSGLPMREPSNAYGDSDVHPPVCELAGFEIECGGRLHRHHIINKSRLRGNKRALRVVEEFWPELFLADVCEAHNVSRWADSKRARAMLFQRRVDLYGAGTVRHALNLLALTFKAPPADLTLEALL